MTEFSITVRGAVAELSAAGDGLLAPDGCERLADLLADVSGIPEARVAVLTEGLFRLRWDGTALREQIADVAGGRRLSGTMQRIAETPLPLLARIQGDAFDAGFELALLCDIRLAADDARLGFPGGASGMLPAGGGASRLARLAGRAAALRMLLTGEPLDAAAALDRGLVTGVYPVDRLAAEAQRLADVIASRGPIAVRYAKEAVQHGADMPLDQALRYETDLTIILQTTRDRAEGVAAFAEKRSPAFTGE